MTNRPTIGDRPQAIAEALRAQGVEIKILAVERFPLGGPNEMYRLKVAGHSGDLAIKFVNKGCETGLDGLQCERELFSLRAAGREGVTVPSIVSNSIAGSSRPFFIMEAIEGRPLQTLLDEISHSQLRELGRALGPLLERLHDSEVDLYGDVPISESTVGRDCLRPVIWGVRSDFQEAVNHRIHFLLSTHCDNALLSSYEEASISRRLRELVGKVCGKAVASLVHGDIHPKNIMVTYDGRDLELTGLIDFDRSLALPAHAEFGISRARWCMGRSTQRFAQYEAFCDGLMETYGRWCAGPETASWTEELFYLMECLESVSVPEARYHLLAP